MTNDMSESHRPDFRSSSPRSSVNAEAGAFVSSNSAHVAPHVRPTANSPEASLNCAPPHEKAPLAPASKPIGGSSHSAGADDVTREIDRAYDGLHRTQAMLMYLTITNRERPEVDEYFEEAQHAYVRALCRYEVLDFESAREFAAVSTNLVCVLEILIANCIPQDPSTSGAG
jgi:hypothetical protein